MNYPDILIEDEKEYTFIKNTVDLKERFHHFSHNVYNFFSNGFKTIITSIVYYKIKSQKF